MIKDADEYTGKVVDALTTNGMWGNTLLVYASDNGQCEIPPPLATDNLLESTEGVLRPPSVFARGCSLLPCSHADACCVDAVIVSKAACRRAALLASTTRFAVRNTRTGEAGTV